MANKNWPVTYYQTPKEAFWPLGLERPEQAKISCQKIRDVETTSLSLKTNLLLNPRGGSMTHRAYNFQKMSIVKKLEKNCANQ